MAVYTILKIIMALCTSVRWSAYHSKLNLEELSNRDKNCTRSQSIWNFQILRLTFRNVI